MQSSTSVKLHSKKLKLGTLYLIFKMLEISLMLFAVANATKKFKEKKALK
jgi:hypothetical protein